MKNSLKKLKGLTSMHRNERREHRLQSLAQLDEVSRASQDMQDMRDCYDSLLSAAAATANSAYEFSESLRDMGECLLEKNALNDDEESGKVLLKLGKVQIELQGLVDNYRSHISQTITVPSESLLNELRIVEEMKSQCDEKRNLYEYMVTKHREKGRLRSNKGECFSSHQLQAACEEYDDEATLFVFRMKSLKRGQSRSLLTQAARHYAAQLCFFRKALKSLEAIEPHVKLVTGQNHIDYHFSGLEDDDVDSDSDDSDYEDGIAEDHEARDDSELSFDYGQNDQGKDVSTSRNSMELDHVDLTFPKFSTVDAAKEILNRSPDMNSYTFGRDVKGSSKSAPLFPEVKIDPGERFRQMRQSSSRRLNTYVLPMPVETRSPVSSGFDSQVPETTRTSLRGVTPHMWHSSPLGHKNYDKISRNEKFSGPLILNTHLVLKESNSNNNTTSSRLPPPLTEGLSSPQLEKRTAADFKKIKRQAFSGPLTGKSGPNKPILSASGPIFSTRNPQLFSGPLLQTALPRPSSTPKLSSSTSPTFVSSPKISELHELPRPPAYSASKRPSNLIGHSAPLVSKGQDHSAPNKVAVFNPASTLPVPPTSVSRSYSIPSGGQTAMSVHVSKPLEAPQNLKIAEDIASPPLTPIFLSVGQQVSTAVVAVIPADQITG